MPAIEMKSFQSMSENVGNFKLTGKTVLIPEMNKIGSKLVASAFRSFDINAWVMETYRGLDLGLEYTSGKECFPCQITLGDILYYLKNEKERKGACFNITDYIYFHPESSGPCRFGMYNKYQRIVLDTFPEYKDLKIGALTTEDGYSLAGIIDKNKVGDLRKSAFFALITGDILDRLLWRIRPYEKERGMADDFIERSTKKMEDVFEEYGVKKDFKIMLENLEEIAEEAGNIIDHKVPQKPLIGIVGEIYLRSHVRSNQDLIRTLEKYGAEVVNASIAEWINYISYSEFQEMMTHASLSLKQYKLLSGIGLLKKALGYRTELFYQERRQKQMYDRVCAHIDIAGDHKVSHLEDVLKKDDVFSFSVATESCLSIAGILEYAREGYNGVVNVYPFTCMPSTTTSAVINPVMNTMGIPYLDTPYDSSFQPGREAAIRTFMYQATQHMKRMGRKLH